jgi:hypothetical protein
MLTVVALARLRQPSVELERNNTLMASPIAWRRKYTGAGAESQKNQIYSLRHNYNRDEEESKPKPHRATISSRNSRIYHKKAPAAA